MAAAGRILQPELQDLPSRPAALRPFVQSDGTWVPSRTNFTSLATPNAVGSGKTALVTLLHEGEGEGAGAGLRARCGVHACPATSLEEACTRKGSQQAASRWAQPCSVESRPAVHPASAVLQGATPPTLPTSTSTRPSSARHGTLPRAGLQPGPATIKSPAGASGAALYLCATVTWQLCCRQGAATGGAQPSLQPCPPSGPPPAGARSHQRGVRRESEHVPGLAGQRRRLDGALLHLAVGAAGAGRLRELC